MGSVEELSDDAFGHWLAGFIDGEGSFVIRRDQTHADSRNYSTRMQLALRTDDASLLEAIQRRVAIGSLYRGGPYGRHPPANARPQILWVVFTKRDCEALVRLLDRYPLLSKKARDYEIWRHAVGVRATKRRLGSKGHLQDWSDMAALKTQLEAVRTYVAPDTETDGAAVKLPPDPQLALMPMPGATS